MRVAILTEGRAEFASLKILRQRLRCLFPHVEITDILFLSVQPDGPTQLIARQTVTLSKIAGTKGADKCVIVLDREQQVACPGVLATAIEAECARRGASLPIKVVYKDRTYENWLLSDPSVFSAKRARYTTNNRIASQVRQGSADTIDGLREISTFCRRDYDKVQDAKVIMEAIDVDMAGKNSRSFRHFLHELGIWRFEGSCRNIGNRRI